MEDNGGRSLKWKKHRGTLINYFNTLLKKGMLADCTLAADGKYIKAHKAILCACSPYFERLLSEHSDKHPILILRDVNFDDLQDLVCYMYEGTVDIHKDRIADFIGVAESLEIKGLTKSEPGDSDSNTKTDSRQQGSLARPLPAMSEIPQASPGLTVPKVSKNFKPNAADVCDPNVPEVFASPDPPGAVSPRKGSQSPVAKKKRRRNVGDDNSMENQEGSNSIEIPQQMGVASLGGAAIGDDKSHSDPEDSFIDLTEDDDIDDSNQHPNVTHLPESRDNIKAGQILKEDDDMLAKPSEENEDDSDVEAAASREFDHPEESDDSGEWKETERGTKKQKKVVEYYTKEEDSRLMRYIIRKELISQTGSLATFRRMETEGIIANRNAKSMKERFFSNLIYNYESYDVDEFTRKEFKKILKVYGNPKDSHQINKPARRPVKWSDEDNRIMLMYIVENNLYHGMKSMEVHGKIVEEAGLKKPRNIRAVKAQIYRLIENGDYEYYITDKDAVKKMAQACKKLKK